MKKIKEYITIEFIQVFFIIVFFVMVAIFAMHMDDVQNGDEVLTYSAANSTVDIWMFALDRPSHWIRDLIYDSSLTVTIKNGIEAIQDVYVNGRNAECFNYPVSDGVWYSGDYIRNCLSVSQETRFDYISVLYNSLLDGANMLLYYLLVHTVSSFFPEYSFSKWCAFSINLLFFIGTLIIFYKLCKKYSLTKNISLALIALYVCTNGLRIVTYLRPYQLLIFFTLFLFYRHVLLFESIEKRENFPTRKFFILLGIVYILGCWSHFLTIVVILILGGMLTIAVFMNKDNNILFNKVLKPYIKTVCLSTIIAIMGMPTFLITMLSKLRPHSTTGTVIPGMIQMTMEFLQEIFINYYIFFAVILFMIVVSVKKYQKNSDVLKHKFKWYILTGFTVGYIVLTIILTKSGTRYLWPAFPFVLIIIGGFLSILQSYVKDSLRKRYKVICWITIGSICLFGILNYQRAYFESEAYNILKARKEIIQEHMGATAIFIRNQSAGFDYAPYLINFSNIMVIEIPGENYRNYMLTSCFFTP